MNLNRVTITGADDSIDPFELQVRTNKFPFVEWGILISRSHEGEPRFPSVTWIKQLQSMAELKFPPTMKVPHKSMNLALHICGAWISQLLKGDVGVPLWLLKSFDRIQLNFHGLNESCADFLAFYDAVERLSQNPGGQPRQIIFQLDGAKGNELYAKARHRNSVDVVPLFDISHGSGTLPSEWLAAQCFADYAGLAGGLGPDNLEAQLPLMSGAMGDSRVWIDMETRVRSDNDQQFDLSKVETCLKLARTAALNCVV